MSCISIHQRPGIARFSTRDRGDHPRATNSAHFHGIPATNEPAVLRPGLLDGVGIAFTGGAEAIAQRANALGAAQGHDVLVHAADPDAAPQHVLDDAWDAIRAHMLPPDRTHGLIVLIAPPPGGPNRAAARAGLENLARTLSIEWARHQIRTVAILPGDEPAPAAELVAFLASRAGAYYSGCAFTLR